MPTLAETVIRFMEFAPNAAALIRRLSLAHVRWAMEAAGAHSDSRFVDLVAYAQADAGELDALFAPCVIAALTPGAGDDLVAGIVEALDRQIFAVMLASRYKRAVRQGVAPAAMAPLSATPPARIILRTPAGR